MDRDIGARSQFGDYAIKTSQALWRYASLGRSLAPARDALREAFAERFQDREPLLAYLRALPARPFLLLPILGFAAFLATNVMVASERRELRHVASMIQHAHAQDGSLGRPYPR